MDAGGRTALLFPGQGSQSVGMGRDLAHAYPEARALFDRADEILGFPLSRLCFEGPEAQLRETRNTQPAIFVHSLAALASLGFEPGTDFHAAAGHSLGEYSAYVAAGSLAYDDALRLVRRRGELMYQAGIDRPGTMAAILGMEPERIRGLLEGVTGIVVPANENGPGQVVISGEVAAVQEGMERCKSAGAKRVIPLEVSGAFHSPLMEGAARGLREALAQVRISPARVPVYANASAAPVVEPEEIRASLAAQLLSPVKWETGIRAMLSAGCGRFVEIGPGRVLCGLMRSIDRSATALAAGGAEEIANLKIGGGGS
ncbi:MAG: ACP S-malonyltransferase [Candidatus Eisenbacteria bacterium]|nr:ACP S-malonyltransferase [Candidatus Eisenbacteria bacterium]